MAFHIHAVTIIVCWRDPFGNAWDLLQMK